MSSDNIKTKRSKKKEKSIKTRQKIGPYSTRSEIGRAHV